MLELTSSLLGRTPPQLASICQAQSTKVVSQGVYTFRYHKSFNESVITAKKKNHPKASTRVNSLRQILSCQRPYRIPQKRTFRWKKSRVRGSALGSIGVRNHQSVSYLVVRSAIRRSAIRGVAVRWSAGLLWRLWVLRWLAWVVTSRVLVAWWRVGAWRRSTAGACFFWWRSRRTSLWWLWVRWRSVARRSSTTGACLLWWRDWRAFFGWLWRAITWRSSATGALPIRWRSW